MNHPTNPREPRGFETQVGILANVKFDGEALRGDLRLYKHHPLAALVMERAEAGGQGFGLSHNASAGRTRRENGVLVIEAIASVRSVDVVANPATNRDLFEAVATSRRPTLLQMKRPHLA